MTCRSVTTTIIAVLIAALALLCLGDLVEAAVPSAEGAPCGSRLCDETGCGTVAATPVATPVARVVIAPPAALASLADTVVPQPRRDRQVTPLAPRSPPVA